MHIAIPFAVLKPSGVRELFRDSSPRFGKHGWLTILIMAWPVTLPLAVRFFPSILTASASVIAVSILLGVTIGVTEELFWRGIYIKVFPDNIWLKYIYPSIAFGAWHFAPQSVLAMNVPGGIYSFAFISTLLGLSWGYYAQKTGNIRWCTVVHIANDTFGLAGFTWIPMLAASL